MTSHRLLLVLPTALLACGGSSTTDTPPADAGADLGPADAGIDTGGIQEGGSYYSLTLVLPSGLSQHFERQIDENPEVLAYGEAHIAPARSLAIEDTFTKPFASVTLNFGFVIASNDHPLTISEEGKWDFGKGDENAPPAFKIETKDAGKPRKLVSWVDGTSGGYLITKWGPEEGDVVQGKISGTLVDLNEPEKTATVEGEFRLILPEPGK